MQETLKQALRRVDEHAREMAAATSDLVEVGPFTALLPRSDGAPAYAVPRTGAGDSDDALAPLAELRRLFTERGLPLRVELSLLAWGELVPSLTSAGLEPEEETPLFVCLRDRFAPAAPIGDIRWIAPEEDLAFVAAVMRQGHELRGAAPSREELAALREVLTSSPLRLAMATLEGAPAGTGCAAAVAGTTEVSAVSTLPTQRRRGVASAMVSFLLAEHFAAGGEIAWACSGDAAAAGLLYKVGFEDAGLRVSFRSA